VERDREACRVIQRNLEKLRLTGADVRCGDVLAELRAERGRRRRYDLVLADAPYEEWDRYEKTLGELLPDVLGDEALAVVETSAGTEPQLPLPLVTTRRYGSARITVFSR
jgi:16S rRNA G966 N2-methylase RsmD